ncbi:peptidase inhibitor family I36 protein [Streptomyces sp. NPDC057838]|uniref:peptidase inhibitor family I36 protein n=1 Tax=unclassified Streptomyces TaxID=2593676 RepID=UPI0036B1527F
MPAIRKTMLTVAALAGIALTSQPAFAQAQASGSWRAYTGTNFSGPDTTFTGEVGECKYVGDNWNDKTRSAKSSTATTRVELWDNADCTGGSIVIDGSGYYAIGAWVSAYRVSSV